MTELQDEMLKQIADIVRLAVASGQESARKTAREIVCQEWNRAVKDFKLSPGSAVESVMGRIINRIDDFRS